MINDPYKVLGVSSNASNDEIKAAYRRLVKQYHPDLNPGNDEAAEKMKEINAAYDRIKNPQKSAGTAGNTQHQGYQGYQDDQGDRSTSGDYDDPFGFGGYWQRYEDTGQTAAEFSAAEHFIRANQFQSALHVLSAVNDGKRNGRWYYLSALANYGAGNSILASDHIRHSIRLEPNNIEYLQALNMMQNGGRVYQQAGSGFPTLSVNPSLACLGCCLSQVLCYFCLFMR
jgi:molecular chaperone DnaJ